MNLTRYNPNQDLGITNQSGVSGLRCFNGEDLCNYTYLCLIFNSGLKEIIASKTVAKRLAGSINPR